MISNPKHGWCNFKLRTFLGTPSYLTDVPVDLLTAFIDYHTKGCGIAWFDEEGTEISLVLTPYSLFVIEERDEKPVLHDFSEMKIEKLEKELIEDIESNLYGWQNYATDDDPEEIKQHRNEILQKIAILKKYMRVSTEEINLNDYVEGNNTIKCPYCGESYYTELYSTTTSMYFPPIYKNGVNVNPDRNKITTHYRCLKCKNNFSYSN